MILSNRHNETIRDLVLGEPLELHGCAGCVIERVWVRRCYIGILLLSCTDCRVRDCIVVDSWSKGEKSGEGHDIQFDKCVGCWAERNTCIYGVPEGKERHARGVNDHISLWNCIACRAVGNTIIGDGRSESGSGICIDGPDAARCVAARNTLIDPGQVGVVVVGRGHRVTANTICGTTNQGIAVYMPAEYGPQKTSGKLQRNQILPRSGGRIWIDDKTTHNVSIA